MEPTTFASFGLSESLMRAVSDLGYEEATPIQAESLPILLEGKNLLGTAQTGTGKTAAFALPLLHNVDVRLKKPQVLVLAPTRELAIQVAEAFSSYARHIDGLHVLPIYGGQSISHQLSALRRGVHVVVGTPGRTLDHLKRGTLNFETIQSVVLDEADEMLQMGFIDDIETILSKTPDNCQIALFSATMPPAIQKIASTYLGDADIVKIQNKTATVSNIEQFYLLVQRSNKMEALTRVLDVEIFDAMIIFVRTKAETVELAERLEARGYAVSALNGDLDQKLREHTVKKLKTKKIDIIVATDIAARGLDVVRITHVINFDIPYDPETYIHRIGRTGRAGRSGKTILFAAPKEKRLLKAIERTTRQEITPFVLPTGDEISSHRIGQFQEKILEIIKEEKTHLFSSIIEKISTKENLEVIEIAAALAWKMQESRPLFPNLKSIPSLDFSESSKRMRSEKTHRNTDDSMQRYRIVPSRQDKINPGDIVGALANEGGLDSKSIGEIQLYSSFSTVMLPKDLSSEVLEQLKSLEIRGKALEIRVMTGDGPARSRSRDRSGHRSGGDRSGQRSGGDRSGQRSGGDRSGQRSGGDRSGQRSGGDRSGQRSGGDRGSHSGNGGGDYNKKSSFKKSSFRDRNRS